MNSRPDATSRPLNRWSQVWLLLGCLGYSWLAMQVVHELGHVGVAWLTGGRVTQVVLHPLAISRTEVEPNPWPLAVAWGGPLLGCLIPLALLATFARWRHHPLLTFWAGFCLVANGLYLGLGSFERIGDAGDILTHGGLQWQLLLFGLLASTAGLWLWHAAAPHFGFGPAPLPIPRKRTLLIWAAFVILLGLLAIRG